MENRTVLIVDDDAGHCTNLTDILELDGYRVHSALSMAKALVLARSHEPQVALLDQKLPDGSGTELLAELKRLYPDCFCIIITAHADLDSAVEALDEGAYHYLRKPFRLDELLGLLKRIFEGVRLREQKRAAEKALRESEEKLAGIINAVADAMLMVNENDDIKWANEMGRRVFGPEIHGKKYYSVIYQDTAPPEKCIVRACFDLGQQQDMEMQFPGPDGSPQDYWCTTNVVLRGRDGRPKRVVMVCRNITEKMELEAEVMRNAQLAAVGELAAVVAHEINNPINGIINYAQILIDQRPGSQPDSGIPEKIIKEGDRIATIVGKLLSFARAGDDKKEAVSIISVIDDVLDLVGATLATEFVQIRKQIPADLPCCRANFQQMQQVVLNIISNARYALNRKFPDAHPQKILDIAGETLADPDGAKLRIAFTDHGTGISEKNLAQVCHPFFSTKPADQGTGLGLSISCGIIEDHQGRFWVESLEGSYTTVFIDLPVYGGDA